MPIVTMTSRKQTPMLRGLPTVPGWFAVMVDP
jgi:hypothetical protein